VSESTPTVGDHYTHEDSPDYPEEIYRVVGHHQNTVTLLRVTHGGQRASTGDIYAVPVETVESSFAPVVNPPSKNILHGLVDYVVSFVTAARYLYR
jgi:hypothetical protein